MILFAGVAYDNDRPGPRVPPIPTVYTSTEAEGYGKPWDRLPEQWHEPCTRCGKPRYAHQVIDPEHLTFCERFEGVSLEQRCAVDSYVGYHGVPEEGIG